MAEAETSQENADEVAASVITYTEKELTAFKENMASKIQRKALVPPFAACSRST